MFTVVARLTMGEKLTVAIATKEEVYLLASILENTFRVVSFHVIYDYIILEEKQLGWGKFLKWINPTKNNEVEK